MTQQAEARAHPQGVHPEVQVQRLHSRERSAEAVDREAGSLLDAYVRRDVLALGQALPRQRLLLDGRRRQRRGRGQGRRSGQGDGARQAGERRHLVVGERAIEDGQLVDRAGERAVAGERQRPDTVRVVVARRTRAAHSVDADAHDTVRPPGRHGDVVEAPRLDAADEALEIQ